MKKIRLNKVALDIAKDYIKQIIKEGLLSKDSKIINSYSEVEIYSEKRIFTLRIDSYGRIIGIKHKGYVR